LRNNKSPLRVAHLLLDIFKCISNSNKFKSNLNKNSFFARACVKYNEFLFFRGYDALHPKYNYFIPFIYNYLGKEINPETEPIITYSFNILILSLIVLSCIISVYGSFLSLYLIKRLDLINRYPKLNKIVKYYENSNLLFIAIEIFISIFFLVVIILLNLLVFLRFIFI